MSRRSRTSRACRTGTGSGGAAALRRVPRHVGSSTSTPSRTARSQSWSRSPAGRSSASPTGAAPSTRCLKTCRALPYHPPYGAATEPHEDSLSCRRYHLSSPRRPSSRASQTTCAVRARREDDAEGPEAEVVRHALASFAQRDQVFIAWYALIDGSGNNSSTRAPSGKIASLSTGISSTPSRTTRPTRHRWRSSPPTESRTSRVPPRSCRPRGSPTRADAARCRGGP
jgi:hypothetical protein